MNHAKASIFFQKKIYLKYLITTIYIYFIMAQPIDRYSRILYLLIILLTYTNSLQLHSTQSHLPTHNQHPNEIDSEATISKISHPKSLSQKSRNSPRKQINIPFAAPQSSSNANSGRKYSGTRKSDGSTFPIFVVGGDDTTFFPQPVASYLQDKQQHDVIIVGGGLSGLVAALYLADNNKKILLLEKENYFGGLAAYREDSRGFIYDRGASYWTKAFNEQFQIIKHIGISRYFTEYMIPEPIDAYFWNGVLYGGHPHQGLWDDRTLGIQVPAKYKNGTSLPVLPSSFGIFKFQLLNANKLEQIPDQPFEKAKHTYLDTLTATEWIRKMPNVFQQRITKVGPFARERRLWNRFQKQIESGVLHKEDPMKEIVQFLELYCRSALGALPDDLSAMGFANFYISQIEPRFTTPFGSGVTAKIMIESLKARPQLTTMKLNSPVVKVKNTDDGVEVFYVENGIGKSAKAKKAIYAAQIPIAPNIIEGIDQKAPQQAKIMRDIKFSHYQIHNVQVTNHPYRVAYDTWTRAQDYTGNDFTDLIVGRWVELKGYHEKEYWFNYETNPDNKGSILSIYHPLKAASSAPVDQSNHTQTDQKCVKLAETAFNRLDEIYKNAFHQKFAINKIVANRWPYSIHIPQKSHFTVKSRKISKTFGNIIFGNSAFGTPSFEEALYRGHCAANKVMLRFDPKFKQQSWSKCEINL